MPTDLLLGIDFGTGSCKVTLIDTRGRTLDHDSAEYPTSHPQPGWAEQNPADWFTAMAEVLRRLQAREAWASGTIVTVALDSYTHGAVLLDESHAVIRPTIIWTDQRSARESAMLHGRHGKQIFETGGQMPTPTWTLPQLVWLRENEPESFARIRCVSFVKDYVRYLLTGVMAVDHIEAQGSLLWDIRAMRWSEELCALAGIPLSVLPEIRKPTDRAGAITPDAAQRTGIPAGTPVIMGASDSAVEDYAAGAIRPGQCVLKLATAGNVNVMTSVARPHPKTLTYSHVVPGLWYTVTATNAAAVCQRWFRDTLCASDARQAAARGENVYGTLNAEAQTSPAGANGVMFHPYLMGERSPYWDSDLRGSFTGIGMHTTRADLSRALLEGVAFSLRDCRRVIDEMALPVDEYLLIGGGAKSALWSQIVCDVMNAPVKCPSSCDAAYGSAILAGVGIGVFPDEVSAVRTCVTMDRELTPNPTTAAVYDKAFSRYLSVHDALAPIYAKKSNR